MERTRNMTDIVYTNLFQVDCKASSCFLSKGRHIRRRVVGYRGVRAWLSLILFPIDPLVLKRAQCIAQRRREQFNHRVLSVAPVTYKTAGQFMIHQINHLIISGQDNRLYALPRNQVTATITSLRQRVTALYDVGLCLNHHSLNTKA